MDPIGSMGDYDGYLLIPRALPWPKRVEDSEDLRTLLDEAESHGWRVQLVSPNEGTNLTPLRYERTSKHAAGFRPFDDGIGDVLICTHGSRDVCCGSLGYRLWSDVGNVPGRRVWRTSHTGGHRFAATAVVLPEGTGWAYLTPELLEGICSHQLDVETALRHFRGSAGLGPPEVQAAEREAFRVNGWSWFSECRTGSIIGTTDGMARVEISGLHGTYEALVEVARYVQIPQCGHLVDENAKSQAEFAVREFRSL